ncbi:MAG: DUF4153 domain-containing protein [Paludibacteraceae bacterium]|nr:DUF4153 domain-containing protein [Paludibacteraceae bacterium]
MLTTFSFRNLKTDWKSVFYQYPFTVGCIVLSTVITIIGIAMGEKLCTAAYFSMFLVIIIHTWERLRAEYGKQKSRQLYIFLGVSVAIWALLLASILILKHRDSDYSYYYILHYLDLRPGEMSLFWIVRYEYEYAVTACCIGFMIYAFFAPRIFDNHDYNVMPLVKAIVLNLLIAFGLAIVVYMVWVGMIWTSSKIFENTVDYKEYYSWFVLIVYMIGSYLYVFSLPNKEQRMEEDNITNFITKTLNVIFKYIAVPIIVFFIMVMLIYATRILIVWELPKVRLSVLVSIIMLLYMFTYTVLYDSFKEQNGWLYKLLTLYIPAAMLPLCVLMTIGIIKRFTDYGITPLRLYILTVNIFFYFVCLYMLLSKRKRFSVYWIVLSSAFILTTALPYNYSELDYYLEKTLFDTRYEEIKSLEELNSQTQINTEESTTTDTTDIISK